MPGPDRIALAQAAAAAVQTPTLDLLVQAIGPIAQKLGISQLVVVGVDPRTGHKRVYGAPETLMAVRDVVAEKFGLADVGETGWDS